MTTDAPVETGASRIRAFPWMTIICSGLFVAVAVLVAVHRVHLSPALPYLIVLACPLMHFFMHRHRHAPHRTSGGGKDVPGSCHGGHGDGAPKV